MNCQYQQPDLFWIQLGIIFLLLSTCGVKDNVREIKEATVISQTATAEGNNMEIELVSDKYRPTYAYVSTQNGVKVKTTNTDGSIVDRLISDEEFQEALSKHLQNGYDVKVR